MTPRWDMTSPASVPVVLAMLSVLSAAMRHDRQVPTHAWRQGTSQLERARVL